jgi:hypothetical protein
MAIDAGNLQVTSMLAVGESDGLLRFVPLLVARQGVGPQPPSENHGTEYQSDQQD